MEGLAQDRAEELADRLDPIAQKYDLCINLDFDCLPSGVLLSVKDDRTMTTISRALPFLTQETEPFPGFLDRVVRHTESLTCGLRLILTNEYAQEGAMEGSQGEAHEAVETV
jgi:hypothetical protein